MNNSKKDIRKLVRLFSLLQVQTYSFVS